MENYIFDLLERLDTKNTFFFLTKHRKIKKEWQLLISIFFFFQQNVAYNVAMENDQSRSIK